MFNLFVRFVCIYTIGSSILDTDRYFKEFGTLFSWQCFLLCTCAVVCFQIIDYITIREYKECLLNNKSLSH